ncbi:MAG: hypothetical protein KDD62_04355 [Bdellovibrionales bacterium]|nr:hypothetical protein [Bdellovibrionales bacterium]
MPSVTEHHPNFPTALNGSSLLEGFRQAFRDQFPDLYEPDLKAKFARNDSFYMAKLSDAAGLAAVLLNSKPLVSISDPDKLSNILSTLAIQTVTIPSPFNPSVKLVHFAYAESTVDRVLAQDVFDKRIQASTKLALAHVIGDTKATEYHRRMGLLFGYPKTAIDYFSKNQKIILDLPSLNIILAETLHDARVRRDTMTYLHDQRISFP